MYLLCYNITDMAETCGNLDEPAALRRKPFLKLVADAQTVSYRKAPANIPLSTIEKFWGVGVQNSLIPTTQSPSSKLLILKKALLLDDNAPPTVKNDLRAKSVEDLISIAKKNKARSFRLQQKTKTTPNVSVPSREAFSDPDVWRRTVEKLNALGSAAVDTIIIFDTPRIEGRIVQPTLGALALGHEAFENLLFSVDHVSFMNILRESATTAFNENTFAKFELI